MLNIVRRNYLALILIVVGCLVYVSNLHNPLFWDDDDWIINNAFVHHLSWSNIENIFSQNILKGFGLNSNYYRPALLISFMFNYLISGSRSLSYHLVSNGFHIGNAVLLFLILFKVTKNRLWAFSTAALFLTHPLQTEAVTYISGRGDPMSVFFMLSALWMFIIGQRGFSLMFFVGAVLSRETAILFPALLTIFYMAFLNLSGIKTGLKKATLKILPYWIVSGLYGIMRITVLNFQNTLNFYDQANIYTEHLSYRLFTFGHALVQYAKLIFIPTHLHMERELAISTSIFQWPVWFAAAGILIILAVVIVLYQKDKNGPAFRVWSFGWGWFFIAMGPVSGIVPINALIYEHWLYLPLIGISVMAGYSISYFYTRWPKIIGKTLLVAFIIYIGLLSGLSARRNLAWGRPIEFYEDILSYNPRSVRILNNLGNLYANSGQLDKAIDEYQKAISLPDGGQFAQPYYNLANLYRDKGDYQGAISQYVKAINTDPTFPFAYQNLAALLISHKDYDDAAKVMERFKQIQNSLQP